MNGPRYIPAGELLQGELDLGKAFQEPEYTRPKLKGEGCLGVFVDKTVAAQAKAVAANFAEVRKRKERAE